MTTPKRGRGRPAKANPRRTAHRVEVRLLPDERAAIEEAAALRGLPVATWVREVALGAARLGPQSVT